MMNSDTGMRFTAKPSSLVQTQRRAQRSYLTGDGTLFLDFGDAVFGTLMWPVEDTVGKAVVVVHLGETLTEAGRVDRSPPGCIRYRRIEQALEKGQRRCRIVIPPDEQNTGPAAVRMPSEIGEVFPFRYAEVEDAAGLDATAVRQVFVHYPFDDEAADFESNDQVLNAVWKLCKHTIKATTFCGVYVDGDRERIPYEADAYINQLGHYCLDREYQLARYTHEWLIQRPTWPTEWHLQSVMMAWADYQYSGEAASLTAFYDELVMKTLIDFARPDGLISTSPDYRTPEMTARLKSAFAKGILREDMRDIVDWPPGSFTDGGTGERDNHDMQPINTVVNAFHAHVLGLMARIAKVLGREADQQRFSARAKKATEAINSLLFDSRRGVYVDGEGSDHASLHSNMFMLAFGLVPEERRASVVAFVKSRGMACSVYGAQFLLEAMYLHGEDDYALELMCARHDRSWWAMIQAGSTMTMEAWALRYKRNLDWNHAWGAAPANIVGRFVLGVENLEPGGGKVIVCPQVGRLLRVAGTVPTARGPVGVSVQRHEDGRFELRVKVPQGVYAKVGLPAGGAGAEHLSVDGRQVQAVRDGKTLFVDDVGPGEHRFSN